MNIFYEQAVELLEKECSALSIGKHEAAMKTAVCNALKEFCRQDEEFSQAVVQGGSFLDCMKAVAKNVGSSISDIEAYRRAVLFYFPGAGVHFDMRIDLCASVDNEQSEGTAGQGGRMLVNLDEFF